MFPLLLCFLSSLFLPCFLADSISGFFFKFIFSMHAEALCLIRQGFQYLTLKYSIRSHCLVPVLAISSNVQGQLLSLTISKHKHPNDFYVNLTTWHCWCTQAKTHFAIIFAFTEELFLCHSSQNKNSLSIQQKAPGILQQLLQRFH